MMAQVDSRNML